MATPYSKLPIRQRIERDLHEIERDIDYWKDSENADHLRKLVATKERLLKQADHYDREESAGYQQPTTHRWRDEPIGGGFGKTINLDDQD